MATRALPESHQDLLERANFAHLATVRPDGAPQSSVMWFAWDGEVLQMTHTRNRQKFANLQQEPRVAISVLDPQNPYRFVEVRARLERTEDDDAQASFYHSLQIRYGNVYPITDAPERVILTFRPELYIAVTNGAVIN